MNSVAAPVSPLENDMAETFQPSDADASAAEMQARIQTLEAELAQMVQVQTAVAHGISHDLRAPLRAIDGFAMQLSRELDDNETATQQLAKIRAAAARMAGLTDSLLEYSRVARTSLHKESVDLGFLADWALMDLRGLHPEVSIDADVQPGLQAYGDERLLRTLFDKLLDNSRKFVAPGNAVSLRISGERGADGLHLQVTDAGIGMNLRDDTQPFEPFLRLHGQREGAGDGLGLAIAEAIVQRHGGRIWMVSAPDQGSEVHILLPDPADSPLG